MVLYVYGKKAPTAARRINATRMGPLPDARPAAPPVIVVSLVNPVVVLVDEVVLLLLVDEVVVRVPVPVVVVPVVPEVVCVV
jgi:hypothetical protein